ncbi:MAG: hypothetical protein ACK55Z_30380, partial [bacterium]
YLSRSEEQLFKLQYNERSRGPHRRPCPCCLCGPRVLWRMCLGVQAPAATLDSLAPALFP